MAIAGRMTKFRIDELSGVSEPAQRGARRTILKSAGGELVEEAIERTFPNAADQAFVAMAARGALLNKAAGPSLAPSPADGSTPPGPDDEIDWPASKTATLADLDTRAKARARKEATTYEAAYVKELEATPDDYPVCV